MINRRAKCRYCNRMVRLRKDGTFFLHAKDMHKRFAPIEITEKNKCQGSNTDPMILNSGLTSNKQSL